MSIIKHVTLQKIVAHDFRYDPRIMCLVMHPHEKTIQSRGRCKRHVPPEHRNAHIVIQDLKTHTRIILHYKCMEGAVT